MFERLRNLFSSPSKAPQEKADVPAIIDEIKEVESQKSIPLGRRIHKLSYRDLDLFLDRDITKITGSPYIREENAYTPFPYLPIRGITICWKKDI